MQKTCQIDDGTLVNKCKSFRMKSMKRSIFLSFFLLLVACSPKEPVEEMIDLDQMALVDEELDSSHLKSDPMGSPQEILMKEETLLK